MLDARLKESELNVDVSATAPLGILLENMARVNFGLNMVTDRKERNTDGEDLKGWSIFTLPLDNLLHLRYSAKPKSGPAFYCGDFTLNSVGDSYFGMLG